MRRHGLLRRGGLVLPLRMTFDTPGALRAVAERLRTELAQDQAAMPLSNPAAAPRNTTLSMGVAELRQTDSFQDLMQRADAALYKAKERGRNRVVCELA